MLKISDLHVSYGGIKALRGINLEVPDGKIVTLIGANGAGKSTLLRTISGLVKAESGSILLDGKDITDCSVTERANLGISFAFQQPVRFKGIYVLDLLRIAAKRNLSISEACTYLSAVGLCAKDYIRREVNSSLSGGELKRIEIATVLARGVRFSIFDEPEAGIDLWSFQNLISVFENLERKVSGSILIISHQERILEIADTIVVMRDGTIADQGTKDEMLPSLLGTSSAVSLCSGIQGRNSKNA